MRPRPHVADCRRSSSYANGFAERGGAFAIAGAPLAADAAIIEAGVNVNLAPMSTLGVTYNGRYSTRSLDHSFKADLSVRF